MTIRRSGFFDCLLLLAFYYLAYRYPFQINSATTSPQYADTPEILAIGKYAVFLIVCFVFSFLALAKPGKEVGRPFRAIWVVLYFYLFAWPIFIGHFFNSSYGIEVGLFFLVPLLILVFPVVAPRSSLALQSKVWIFVLISVLFSSIQIGLFIFVDRLPALAYAGTLSVRFGGVWDDPNGFGLFCAFLIPFVFYYRANRIVKRCLIALLFFLLLLTQSLTAIAAAYLAICIGGFLIGIVRKGRSALFGVSAFAVGLPGFILVLVFASPLGDIINMIVSSKAGSIEGHARSFDAVKSISSATLLGFDPRLVVGESGVVNLLSAFGAPYVLAYIFSIAAGVVRVLLVVRGFRADHSFALIGGSYFLLIALLIGIWNLPIESIFPLNLLLAICLALTHLWCQIWTKKCGRPWENRVGA